MSQLIGQVPEWRVENYTVDELGGIKLEMVIPWTPNVSGGRVPQFPTPPDIADMRRGVGRWKRLSNGGAGMSFIYEGVEDGVGGDNPDFRVRWSCSGTFRQIAVELAPDFADIAEKFEWDFQRREFPSTYSGGSNGGARGASSSSADDLNPLYGVKTYDDYAAVVTKHYIVGAITSGIFGRVNKIVSPPFSLGEMEDGRNWKGGPVSFSPFGDYYRVDEPFLLSGPGGWGPLYDR